MSSKLDNVFQFHQQALALRTYRQQVLASNIANADTPGYKARDVDFASTLKSALGSSAATPSAALERTAAGHLGGKNDGAPVAAQQLLYRTPSQPSIDGNTVEMDQERAQFADNSVKMEASLTFLNQQIKTLLSAIQG